MKNKKVSLLISVFIFLFLIVDIVSANDGFGIGYDPKHNLINCIVVTNADQFNTDNLYLYFDYSLETGKKLGRPWARVESGKCYEYSTDISDPSQFVMIKTDNLDFINYLDTNAKNDFDTFSRQYLYETNGFTATYQKYKDSFSIYFDVEDNDWPAFKHEGLGSDVYINYINEIDMKVFKYDFGHGITSGISDGNGEDLLSQYLIEKGREDLSIKLFSARKEIIQSLEDYSSEISSEYTSCLLGIKRIEFHEKAIYEDEYSQKFESVGIFVLNKDNQLIKINKLYDYLSFECKQNIYEIHKKWLEIINKKGDLYYSIVQEIKEFQEKNPNWTYSQYGEQRDLQEYIPWSLGYIVDLNENVVEIKIPKSDEKNNELIVSNIKPSDLDSEDIDTVQNIKNNFGSINDSNNLLFYLYSILPLIAIIIGLFIYKRRKA